MVVGVVVVVLVSILRSVIIIIIILLVNCSTVSSTKVASTALVLGFSYLVLS